MEETEIEKIIREILLIDVGDRIEFKFEKLEPIREDSDYNNFRVYFVAHYGKIANKMKIDHNWRRDYTWSNSVFL